MKKIISICIPTLNSERYLLECLSSISKSTKNYNYIEEILFCDSNSVDDTLNIIDQFIKAHPIAKIISFSDKGQSDAINKAISVAKSEYFMWLNSDDKLDESFFEYVFEILSLRNKYFTITADTINIDCNSKFLSRCPSLVDSPFLIKRGVWFGSFPCRIFLTEIIKREKLNVNLNFCMDFDLIHKVAMNKNLEGIKFSYHISKFLGFFRHHSLSKTTSGVNTALIKSEFSAISRRQSKILSVFIRLFNPSYIHRRFIKKFNL